MTDLASTTYGYQAKVAPVVVNTPMEDNRPSSNTIGGWQSNHHSLGMQNPLFWVLILALVVLGYLGFMFDVKVGK